ncbi:peptidase domain-containing ABC transporter [Erwinia mallotivora]|uniref:ABC-type xenobiotic transporter n=1 Tax=Erwinia mallotivora TaxID=69222 RepID=A0A014MFS9_9GAMM|nr:peptidase domain-containing ABC transporter [Erwinia mallotivora]EXU76964.1 ABC transporter [Erwinia mallotivora]
MKILEDLQFSWRKKLPVLHQTQAAECGLTCVGMIAGYYGHKTDMITLRRSHNTSQKGATLADVMVIANNLGLSGRALRLELDELDKLQLPCILHWDMNHFVVLKKVTKKSITLHDPARGKCEIPLDQVSDSFTGVALELHPNSHFEAKTEKTSLSMLKLIGGVSGIGAAFAQVMALSIALEIFGLLSPFYMQWVMDQVLVSADRELLTLLSCTFLCVVVLRTAISALRSWVTTWFSSLLSVQWSTNVCTHLLGLPMTYFQERHIGDIVSRFGSISTIQNTLTTRFISSVLDGIMAIVTLIVLFCYNMTLTLIVLVTVAIYTLLRAVSFRPFRQANEDQLIAGAKAQSQLLESIRGMQAVKLNNKAEIRVSSYAAELVQVTNKGIQIQRLSILFSVLQGLASGISRIVLVWLAAIQVLDGNFTGGMLVAFISFSDQFISRTTGLVDAIIEFTMLRLHGERLADIVLTESEEYTENQVQLEDQTAACSVEIHNIDFRYAETEPFILKNTSLTIQPGESVAIIGPSGQGKTTLAKLLLGLLRPESGEICINGIDITRLGMKYYRNRIGSVMQDDILFAGSIMDNICFFDAIYDEARAMEVAQIARVHEDIMAMPMGYNSLVGDMGSSLSGGQIQRVLLARALYRQPQLLILDEATSHLDVERESAINNAIASMNVTRVIIAHRPETIMSADRVICLDKGEIRQIDKELLFQQRPTMILN